MVEIVQEKVKIISEIHFINILRFTMVHKKDEHAYVEIQGTANSDSIEDVANRCYGSVIRIFDINDDGEIMFSGNIEEIELEYVGMLCHIRLKCFSHTIIMDRRAEDASYQDVEMTYLGIIQNVMQRTRHGKAIYNIQDKKIGFPVIRYRETDWQFIKRIASYMGVSIFPRVNTSGVGFYIGYPAGREYNIEEYEHMKYIITKDKAICYQVTNREAWQIGDRVTYRGCRMYVVEKRAEFVQAFLQYTYMLADEQYIRRKPFVNGNLKGVSLKGKVIGVEKEAVKIHLNIDDQQKAGHAYWFPYLPETGNIMYCMPEIGDDVRLYMGCGWERNAVATSCVRESAGERQGAFFITPHGKKLLFDEQKIGFDSDTENGQGSLWLQDEKIMIQDSHMVKIAAENRLSVQAANLQVAAPEEVTLMKRDMMQPSVINLCQFVDIIANKSGIECSKETGEIRTISADTAEEGIYKLGEMKKDILATIPFDGMENEMAKCLFKSSRSIVDNK